MSIKAEFEKKICNPCYKAQSLCDHGREDKDECYIKHLETLIKKDYIKRSESVQIIDDKLKELRKAFNMLNVKDLIRNMFEHHLDDIKQNLTSEVKPKAIDKAFEKWFKIKYKKSINNFSKQFTSCERIIYNHIYSNENCKLKNCKLCGQGFGHELMKYNFPETEYIICHSCYGKIYDSICDTIKHSRQEDEKKMIEIVKKWKWDNCSGKCDEAIERLNLLIKSYYGGSK